MRKTLISIVALMLLAAMAASALAVTFYVTKDKAKVYKKPSKKAELMSQLPYGGSVDVFEVDGNWSHIHYINKKGAEKTGWIATKHLSASQPCQHVWSEWKITKAATCSKAGEKSHYCTKCGLTKTKETKKAKHTWGAWTITKPATCAAKGERVCKCKVCGATDRDKIDQLEHTFGAWSVEQAATCAAKGIQTRVCTVCGFKETGEIEPLPHTFGSWISAQKVTREADGVRMRTCAVCGYEEQDTIQAAPAFTRKDRGEGVRTVQQMLTDLGYNAGKADGIYGPKLDKAFEGFAGDNGVAFEAGRLLPVQLDALMSKWIAAVPAGNWKGEGDSEAPVSLLLEMNLTEASADVCSFNWTLTDKGAEDCTLKAVLMSTESDYDFKQGAMVVALDSAPLKAASGEGVTGTISIPAGMGSVLCFRALVEEDKTGDKWLSNAVSFAMGN